MRNDEVRRTTGQLRLSAIVQARRLSLFGHSARMPDETECQEYHNCFPFGELEETTRTSSNYVDEDYPARPEIKQSFPWWGDNCGLESSTLETDVCIWRYAPLVVLATQEEEEATGTWVYRGVGSLQFCLHVCSKNVKKIISELFLKSMKWLCILQLDPDPEFPTVKYPNPEEGKSVLVNNSSLFQMIAIKE